LFYQVVFSDTAIFVGAKTRYAWLGMTAFDSMAKQTDLHLFPDFFRRMEVFAAMEKRELSLPFVGRCSSHGQQAGRAGAGLRHHGQE
jgi:hypothetical protein